LDRATRADTFAVSRAVCAAPIDLQAADKDLVPDPEGAAPQLPDGTPHVPVSKPKGHEIDWHAHRARLEAEGDHEALAFVDECLPHLTDHPWTIGTAEVRGRRIDVHTRLLTAVDVLDWLRDRSSAQDLLRRLAPAINLPSETVDECCRRWRVLSEWVPRFGLGDANTLIVGFGAEVRADHRPGGMASPYRGWTLAFRAATARFLDLVGVPEDVAVHRLLQDIDDVLAGKSVALGINLREVDLVVRIVEGRMGNADPNSPSARPQAAQGRQVDPQLSPIEVEIESFRRERKRERVDTAGSDVSSWVSLWRETTDLLFRTTITEDARVEELAHLRTVTSSLARLARAGQMPRSNLLLLDAELNTLMPRAWFHDAQARQHLLESIARAHVEVVELHDASGVPTKTTGATATPEPEVAASGSADSANVSEPTDGSNQSPASVAVRSGRDGNSESPGFFLDGGGWTLEFGGQRRVAPDLSGMLFIQRLLASPGVSVAAGDLVGQLGVAQSSQEIADDKMIREALARQREIQEDLDGDNAPLNPEAEERLRKELDDLRDYLRGVVTPRGSRPMKSNSTQAVGRVRSAIGRALDAIKKVHAPLWAHLDGALIGTSSASPCYRPVPHLTWRVNAGRDQ
jgi:hypothetical protein